MQTVRVISAALLASSFLGGCASIVDGSTQALSVQTVARDGGQVTDAHCSLVNSKGTFFVTTPGTVQVHRDSDNLQIDCTKDGLDPGLATVKSSTKGMAFGNILAGGFIGAAVDMSTGAAYDYPALITVRMGRSVTIGEPPAEVAANAPPKAGASAPAAVQGAGGEHP